MVGLDIGTGFLVSARQDDNGTIQCKSIRDAFLDLENDPSVKSMLKMSKINYIETEDKLYICGDSAPVLANLFKRECRRPLSKGVLSPGEFEAEKILLVLLETVIGRSLVPNETCFYSIPANPIDHSIDVVYHTAMFSKLISSLGYKPISMLESAAIVYSNCAAENFSAIALSLGAGMVNVCLMYQTMTVLSFSMVGCGDWLDEMVSKSTANTAGRAQSVKERGINLLDPNEGDPKTFREREAYIIYYKSLVLRVLDAIKTEFSKQQGVDLPIAIPIVLSGGTSLPKGFKELFEAGFNTVKDKFPIRVSEIKMASSPLNSVAQGLLVAAMNYDEGNKPQK